MADLLSHYLGLLKTREFCQKCPDLDHCKECVIPWVINYSMDQVRAAKFCPNEEVGLVDG